MWHTVQSARQTWGGGGGTGFIVDWPLVSGLAALGKAWCLPFLNWLHQLSVPQTFALLHPGIMSRVVCCLSGKLKRFISIEPLQIKGRMAAVHREGPSRGGRQVRSSPQKAALKVTCYRRCCGAFAQVGHAHVPIPDPGVNLPSGIPSQGSNREAAAATVQRPPAAAHECASPATKGRDCAQVAGVCAVRGLWRQGLPQSGWSGAHALSSMQAGEGALMWDCFPPVTSSQGQRVRPSHNRKHKPYPAVAQHPAKPVPAVLLNNILPSLFQPCC